MLPSSKPFHIDWNAISKQILRDIFYTYSTYGAVYSLSPKMYNVVKHLKKVKEKRTPFWKFRQVYKQKRRKAHTSEFSKDKYIIKALTINYIKFNNVHP